ncbi:MAG TPA: hypothetical protein VF715_06800 [Thermoleophilaceae bacterium]
MALVKSMYALPTWSGTVRLVAEHAGLRDTLSAVPSQWACYRFAAKLRDRSAALAACLDRVTAGLHKLMPGIGENVALDGSDLPAYANGQRYVSKNGPERERYSDPDASWGHRSAVSTRKGGGFYGFKVHAAVCTKTGLPLAWTVETAREVEQTYAGAAARDRQVGEALRPAVGRRARVRLLEARVGLAPAAPPWNRARATARRPDHLGPALPRARACEGGGRGASRAPRGAAGA